MVAGVSPGLTSLARIETSHDPTRQNNTAQPAFKSTGGIAGLGTGKDYHSRKTPQAVTRIPSVPSLTPATTSTLLQPATARTIFTVESGNPMGKTKDSGRINLRDVFLRAQEQMLANLAASNIFEHPTSCGAATEQHWIDLFNRYLPQRYRATRAFILDADGNRSRQIDIAIYDHFYSPLLFHHDSEPHIPAESVYAVFEVKQTLIAKWIADAGRKAASVRRLRRTSAPILSAGSRCPPKPPSPILAGILSLDAVWAGPFPARITPLVRSLRPDERLDLGCSLRQCAFEVFHPFSIHFSRPQDALIYFMLRLIGRLQLMGAAPAIDFSDYSRCLQ